MENVPQFLVPALQGQTDLLQQGPSSVPRLQVVPGPLHHWDFLLRQSPAFLGSPGAPREMKSYLPPPAVALWDSEHLQLSCDQWSPADKEHTDREGAEGEAIDYP